MSLISLNEVGKDFGTKPLFENLSFVISARERVAVIGQNGCGKSTLLKIISGKEDLSSGEIVRQRGLEISYVKQVDSFAPEATPLSVISDVSGDAQLAQHLPEYKIKLLLNTAGFTDVNIPVTQLSGGWKKRLSIIAGTCTTPDLLLLDEPTNHLDLPGILWLEELLINFSGAVLFVSHDRYFIERVAERSIEIDRRFPAGFVSAAGGYSAIVEKREEILSNLRSQKSSLSNKVRREVEWLRAGVKARTTKSKARIDEAHRLIDELNKMQLDSKAAELGFASTGRKTKELIKLEHTSGGYDTNILWQDLSLIIYPGSRVGIVGANGSGKTSLLKTMIGEIPVLKGKIIPAKNLKINFFGQMREGLDPSKTVKEILSPKSDFVVVENREIHVITWAMRFLFRSEQLGSRIADLSGGEQARLLLAKISLLESDLLIFDEPTNDLDIQTLEVLEQSFIEYPGAILIVSHDRYLMSRVCTDVLGFLPQPNGYNQVLRFADYMQFEIAWDEVGGSKLTNKSSNEVLTPKKTKAAPTQPEKPKATKGLTFHERKEFQSLERKIESATKRQDELKSNLIHPDFATDANKLMELQAEITTQSAALEEMLARWLELSEKQ
ncbi:ABC-F family ATP-binding cassette domain-containing protein [bacterium]|nr:ABC-F family ATP-binding cassette domain-containing protein [bacterium]